MICAHTEGQIRALGRDADLGQPLTKTCVTRRMECDESRIDGIDLVFDPHRV